MSQIKPWYVILIMMWSTGAMGQDIELKTYDSVEEGLYFDQAFIYSLSDHTGKSGEIWIFYSTCSKRLLFDHAAWGGEEGTLTYVIAQQDGSYITFEDVPGDAVPGIVAKVDSVFQERGNNAGNFPISDEDVKFTEISPVSNTPLASRTFALEKPKDPLGKEILSLAEVDFDTRMIYLFNSLDLNVKLPDALGQYLHQLAPNQLITSSYSSFQVLGGELYWSKLDLVAVDPTTYWVPLEDVKLMPKSTVELQTPKDLVELVKLSGPCY